MPVTSRQDLRDKLAGRASGGVFLTTIHKFTEDIQLLLSAVILSVSQMKLTVAKPISTKKLSSTKKTVRLKKTYGFAKYLHDSPPNATLRRFYRERRLSTPP